ncbi:hypothetical protein C8R32_104130 [Nitrosospira sp. Nsp5]|uniref:Uncharacterized protein n=1 Tax=Nitrosospira multiformis TaxID=1231 RepID=A0ABY0TE95_9PROT|nr:hypothetical protein C8R32_104130 [Nitrosospira sp. Nsp5]SDQ69832.1 hypothetical protein SAMN05216402_1909 [Nitrosospira multiformis]
MGGHAGKMGGPEYFIYTSDMDTTQHTGVMQRWQVVQGELMPELRLEADSLTPKLEKVVHTLEWVRIEQVKLPPAKPEAYFC